MHPSLSYQVYHTSEHRDRNLLFLEAAGIIKRTTWQEMFSPLYTFSWKKEFVFFVTYSPQSLFFAPAFLCLGSFIFSRNYILIKFTIDEY